MPLTCTWSKEFTKVPAAFACCESVGRLENWPFLWGMGMELGMGLGPSLPTTLDVSLNDWNPGAMDQMPSIIP